jgi:hypothetical protein
MAEKLSPEQHEQNDEEFQEWYNAAKDALADHYGVTDLTPIEAVRLQQILREVLEDNAYYIQKRDSPSEKIADHNIVMPNSEAIARWFLDYNINIKTDPDVENNMERFKENLRFLREQAHNP